MQIMAGTREEVHGCTQPLSDCDAFGMFDGDIKVECFHSPGHTRGQMMYYLEAAECKGGEGAADSQHVVEMVNGYKVTSNINRCVFTGDALFVGGCGKFLDGNDKSLMEAMDLVLSLPGDTKIFPGHERTSENMKFCREVEPENKITMEFEAKYTKILEDTKVNVPTVLADER